MSPTITLAFCLKTFHLVVLIGGSQAKHRDLTELRKLSQPDKGHQWRFNTFPWRSGTWQECPRFLYSFSFFLFLKNIYLFIWQHQVLVAAHGVFSCGTWDLVPWPGIDPRGPLHWEHGVLTTGPPGQSLSTPFQHLLEILASALSKKRNKNHRDCKERNKNSIYKKTDHIHTKS